MNTTTSPPRPKPSLTWAWVLTATCSAALGCATGPNPATSAAHAPPDDTVAEVTNSEAPSDAGWQASIDEEAQRIRSAFEESTVRILVLDPQTQAPLAAHGPVDDVHATGSTMKGLTAAVALARGADPDTPLDCTGPAEVAGASVEDFQDNGGLTFREGLARSSNVCTVKLLETLGWQAVHADVRRLVPLPERGADEERAAVFELFGADAHLTTRQLASAYATIANDGLDARTGDRWIPAEAAHATRAMLRYAVDKGTGERAKAEGLVVAGKTGTAPSGDRHTALFVGIVGDAPSTVVAVVVEGVPRSESGGTLAAASFARIVRAQQSRSVASEEAR